MNKYSLNKLDTQMTFNHSILNTLCCEFSISHKIQRVDDYEFTLEISNVEDLDIYRLENILNKIISFCSKHFWDNLRFKIDEINTNNIKIEGFTNLMVDVFIVKSNQKEIFMEVFIYQNTTNLYSMLLISKKNGYVKV